MSLALPTLGFSSGCTRSARGGCRWGRGRWSARSVAGMAGTRARRRGRRGRRGALSSGGLEARVMAGIGSVSGGGAPQFRDLSREGPGAVVAAGRAVACRAPWRPCCQLAEKGVLGARVLEQVEEKTAGSGWPPASRLLLMLLSLFVRLGNESREDGLP